jgi:hypothetical protein
MNQPPNKGPSGGEPTEAARPGDVPGEAVQAAAAAYYTRAAGQADAARQRAQTAFTMSSAIAAALAAGGALTHISAQPRAVQILGFCAFAAWLVTAGLLLWAAVGEYRRDDSSPRPAPGVAERDGGWVVVGNRNFIHYLYSEIEHERNAVYDRLALALVLASLAIILTAGAVGVRLFDHQPSAKPRVEAEVSLSRAGVKRLSAACPTAPTIRRISGAIDPAAVGQEVVAVQVDPGTCDSQKTLNLHRAEIRQVQLLGAAG